MAGRWIAAGLAVLGVGALARWQLARLFVEEPAHDVERRIDGVEIRTYADVVRAETTVEAASAEQAVDEGFRRLAGYIFGRNVPRARIATTAHAAGLATATRARDVAPLRPERIAMTTPVTQSARGPGSWTVTFTLPSGRARTDFPAPEDARVTLRSVRSRRVAALRYRGRATARRAEAKARELRAKLARAGIEARGEVVRAQYDPPWVLPFLRRNEVWLELP